MWILILSCKQSVSPVENMQKGGSYGNDYAKKKVM